MKSRTTLTIMSCISCFIAGLAASMLIFNRSAFGGTMTSVVLAVMVVCLVIASLIDRKLRQLRLLDYCVGTVGSVPEKVQAHNAKLSQRQATSTREKAGRPR